MDLGKVPRQSATVSPPGRPPPPAQRAASGDERWLRGALSRCMGRRVHLELMEWQGASSGQVQPHPAQPPLWLHWVPQAPVSSSWQERDLGRPTLTSGPRVWVTGRSGVRMPGDRPRKPQVSPEARPLSVSGANPPRRDGRAQALDVAHPRTSIGSSSLRQRPPGSSAALAWPSRSPGAAQPSAERLMGCLRSSSSRP